MRASQDYKSYNHHHELSDQHEVVDFGDGAFVANRAAIPLLKALHELGLRTRTHHIAEEEWAFVSVLLGPAVSVEVRAVNEIHAERTRYNGQTEVLIRWRLPKHKHTLSEEDMSSPTAEGDAR